MTVRQWAHLPLLLLLLALAAPAFAAALVMRVTFTLLRYLHRIYMPSEATSVTGGNRG